MSITKIQKVWRGFHTRSNSILYSKKIIQTFQKHNNHLNSTFIKYMKIFKLYPPSKNEYKFIFGGLIQKVKIDLLKRLFKDCTDLDNNHHYGSEYRVDCRLKLTSHVQFDLSIKAKSKKTGNIILINKNGGKHHNLSGLITLIIVLENKKIYIIPHCIVNTNFIKDTNTNISYSGSILTYFDKNYSDLVYQLTENMEFNNFINGEYKYINGVDIYTELVNRL